MDYNKHINKVKNFKQFINEDLSNIKKVMVGNYQYIIDTEQKVEPDDYYYMAPIYNDGKTGFIIKVKNEQTYPKTNDNPYWSKKDDGSVYNIEVLTPEVLSKNKHDGKVYIPEAYHLSHCNSHGSGKIISTNNKLLKLN